MLRERYYHTTRWIKKSFLFYFSSVCFSASLSKEGFDFIFSTFCKFVSLIWFLALVRTRLNWLKFLSTEHCVGAPPKITLASCQSSGSINFFLIPVLNYIEIGLISVDSRLVLNISQPLFYRCVVVYFSLNSSTNFGRQKRIQTEFS